MNATISSSWSNGQTESQICNLNLVKLEILRRKQLDLLQALIVGATWPTVGKCVSGLRLDANLQNCGFCPSPAPAASIQQGIHPMTGAMSSRSEQILR